MTNYSTTTKVFRALGWKPPSVLICDDYQVLKNSAGEYGWYRVTPDKFIIMRPDSTVAIYFIPHQHKFIVPAILGKLVVTS
ncbi:MAG: hypothetical protein L3J22_05610 [Xanthomonadales bacterium]|nr:hypothetical protein [Xanthomonadales bacterium]